MNETVLLLDGRAISTLAAARQLDKSGATVHVAESFEWNLTAFSGATAASHSYPSAEDQPAAFERRLLALVEEIEPKVVIPARDATTHHVAALADQLPEGTETLLDSPETIDQLRDKRRCANLAADLDVPIPATYDPERRDIEVIREEAEFPVVIKPTDASGARGIRRVDQPEQLRETYSLATQDGTDVLVQEYVDHSGGHFSIGTVFDRDGTVRALHVYEELRQYPDSGGPAIRARSIEPEPWVFELLELLEAIEWTGPAHMDVLFDPVDETYKLLEVNPRLWSSLALTVGAGVDVPGTIVSAANRQDPGPPGEYDTRLDYRWVVPNELLWALDGWETPARLGELVAGDERPTVYSILSRTDPGALLGTGLQSIRFLLDGEKRAQVLQRNQHQPNTQPTE